jgi:hypothetical protein
MKTQVDRKNGYRCFHKVFLFRTKLGWLTYGWSEMPSNVIAQYTSCWNGQKNWLGQEVGVCPQLEQKVGIGI